MKSKSLAIYKKADWKIDSIGFFHGAVLLYRLAALEKNELISIGWLLPWNCSCCCQPTYHKNSFCHRLASGLEKLMLSSSQEINVDKEDLEILQFIQVEGSNP